VPPGLFLMGRRPWLCDAEMAMATTQHAPSDVRPDAAYPFRRATRDTETMVLGGVAAGLGRHLGVPVLWLRVAFVVGTALSGLGIVLYAAWWMFLPADAAFETGAPGTESATRGGRRPGRRRLTDLGPVFVLGVLGLGAVLLAQATLGQGALIWAAAVMLVGVALLWRQADEAQRERFTAGSMDPVRLVFGRGGWAAYARVGVGLALVIVALVIVGFGGGSFQDARVALLAGGLGVVGIAVVLGPWLVRLSADLGAERAERIRTQERADVAAHLHDSVLQTLALIQKSADNPAAVSRLARAQERDLRAWLYAGDTLDDRSVASALRAAAAEVEDLHGASVDVVAVGDCPMHEGLRPVIGAAKEAIANAAKHAGTGRVDVYAEVEAAAVAVFIRDRGVGFDPAAVPADRLGVRNSIVDRMTRHGGSADVRSEPGAGTEVRLRLPRTATSEESR
jgi:signal transduction histidine kinase/phage shock protein PspC (stress-responsive transcriptional regulator)